MKHGMWWLVVALGACGPTVVSPALDGGPDAMGEDAPDDAPKAPDAAVVVDVVPAEDVAPVCLALGARCRGVGGRCCDGYCDYQPYGYSTGSERCVAFLTDGEYCTEGRRCASGRCVDEVCRAAACVATDARCHDDATCCEGFCTASAMSYAPGRCAVAQPEGASCDGPRWCLSGRCVDGACAR